MMCLYFLFSKEQVASLDSCFSCCHSFAWLPYCWVRLCICYTYIHTYIHTYMHTCMRVCHICNSINFRYGLIFVNFGHTINSEIYSAHAHAIP